MSFHFTTSAKKRSKPPNCWRRMEECVVCSPYILYRHSINSDKNMKKSLDEKKTAQNSHPLRFNWLLGLFSFRAKSEFPCDTRRVLHCRTDFRLQFSCDRCWKSQCIPARWQIVVWLAAVISRLTDFSCDEKREKVVVPAHCSAFINNRASRHHCIRKNPLQPTERKENICTIDKGISIVFVVFVLSPRRTHTRCDHVSCEKQHFLCLFVLSTKVRAFLFSIPHNGFSVWRRQLRLL